MLKHHTLALTLQVRSFLDPSTYPLNLAGNNLCFIFNVIYPVLFISSLYCMKSKFTIIRALPKQMYGSCINSTTGYCTYTIFVSLPSISRSNPYEHSFVMVTTEYLVVYWHSIFKISGGKSPGYDGLSVFTSSHYVI